MPRRAAGPLVLLLAAGVAVGAGHRVVTMPSLATQAAGAGTAPADALPARRSSGSRRLQLPAVPYRYADVSLPEHFTTQATHPFDNTPPDNPITDQGATLGRVLFYDTRLSKNA